MNQSDSTESSRLFAADAQGPRDEQQDAAIHLSAPSHGTALLVVSDGVGGNSGGRLASQAVVDSARELWRERNGKFEDPWTDLDALCRTAHREMNRCGAKRGLSPRATVVALYLTPYQAFWVHCGDSRLYHFRSGKLVKRTEDHSVVEILVKQGMLSETQMGAHPDQGRLLRSLGGEDYKPPTQGTTKLIAKDAFLLCTDGFWERTKVEEMGEVLFGPRSTAELRLRQAVERAVKRNGPKGDNVTLAVALPAPEATAGRTLPTARRQLIPVLVGVLVLLALLGFWATKRMGGQHRHRSHQPTAPIVAATPAPTVAASPQQSTPEQTSSPLTSLGTASPTPSPSLAEEDATLYESIKSISIDGKIPGKDR